MIKNKIQYQISTELRQEGDEYTVYDKLTFESGRQEDILRYKGGQSEAEEVFEKIGRYWHEKLKSKPSL